MFDAFGSRFEVHEKLQNFMVPVPHRGGAWHDEQIDELFSSLMGKGISAPSVQDESPAISPQPVEVGLEGLRVF
jgi:protein AATF/BFR2